MDKEAVRALLQAVAMQIYLLRHGIAETAGPGQADSERSLVPEGRRKLREVLKVAKTSDVRPSLILTSPYRRAVQTAEVAAAVLGYKSDLLRTKALEPGSDPSGVWDEVRVHRDHSEVMLVGHEPLFSQLTAYLLNAPSLVVDFKKGALVRIDLDNFGPRPRGILRWFMPPKVAARAEH
jgi:phosphohistidine phosphatase